MLETLASVAERDDVQTGWDTANYEPLKYARTCYCHLAGDLGVQQHDALIAQRVLVPNDNGAPALGAAANDWLHDARFSADANASIELAAKKKRLAYSCMDCSARRFVSAAQSATVMIATP